MTIEVLLMAMENQQGPADEADIIAFETEIGAKLPADYRAFLSVSNGGCVGGALWFHGPTPKGEVADVGVHHVGGLRPECHLGLRSARATYQDSRQRIPRELIWIMDDPFGNAICLGIVGTCRGKVYFWDHELESSLDDRRANLESVGNVQLLAETFSDFVADLQPVYTV
jgi:hypothetical protein